MTQDTDHAVVKYMSIVAVDLYEWGSWDTTAKLEFLVDSRIRVNLYLYVHARREPVDLHGLQGQLVSMVAEKVGRPTKAARPLGARHLPTA